MNRNLIRVFALMLAVVFCAGLIPAVNAAELQIRDTAYSEELGLRAAMSADPEDPMSTFTVTGPEGEVAIKEVTRTGNKIYTIVTEQPLDVYSSYTLSCGEQTVEIRMPNIYSTNAFEEEFTYTGDDLGATWSAEQTTFRVWAPTADAVRVQLYESGHEGGLEDMLDSVPMTEDVNGTWVATIEGDLNGTYYTYAVKHGDSIVEACDPYARTTGANGKRAMVIDLDSTDPLNWDKDEPPRVQGINEAVIYELHVRDLSSDPSSGITQTGKFLGLIQEGTTNADGIPTGLDHIVNLGVTHIHLLPSYDYASVDETDPDAPFNWGYDPVNYNVPEGSYSTDPYHGEVRVKEFKQMVQGLHKHGIGVILDVVYNHVYDAGSFCFNKIVPDYFTRIDENGTYSNGSFCGNDTASERSMVRKYIVDSVKYWADEYHLDGFRFDLLGLIDVQTVNEVIEEVHKTHPHVIFYAEGWTMNTEVTRDNVELATQKNAELTPGMSFFSDTIRDAIRGSNSNATEPGYVAGAGGHSSNITNGFLGKPSWAVSPSQVINYASCHDGLTLMDRITLSTSDRTVEERVKMNNLAAAVVMTSQGVPFIQAGEEMLRSKPLPDGSFDHNSYKSSDKINSIKWDDLSDPVYQDVVDYYRGLIEFRMAHRALRMTSAEEVAEKITVLPGMEFNVTGFHIAKGANGEENELVVLFNPTSDAVSITLPEGQWNVCINGEDAGTEVLATAEGTVEVAPISAMALVLPGEEAPAETVPSEQEEPAQPKGNNIDWSYMIAAVALGFSSVLFVRNRNRRR